MPSKQIIPTTFPRIDNVPRFEEELQQVFSETGANHVFVWFFGSEMEGTPRKAGIQPCKTIPILTRQILSPNLPLQLFSLSVLQKKKQTNKAGARNASPPIHG